MSIRIINRFIRYSRLLVLAAAASVCPETQASDISIPVFKGEIIPDSDGNHVNAHGGNILRVDSTFYWYGEYRGDGTPGSYQKGIACYSSTDLRNWTYRGLALAVSENEASPIQRGCIMERPKVVYCPATGRYVMWFHHELKGRGYEAAMAGTAVSDTPVGPFEYRSSARVNAGVRPMNMPEDNLTRNYPDTLEWWTPEWYEAVSDGMFAARDFNGGQMARDMTVYVDPATGRAYHIYSSEENLTIQIAELDSTFEHHTGRYVRIFPGGHNEAPTIFRHGGKYWMITSGCTGWDPNEARLMCADSVMGEWKQLPNPCRGPMAEVTFGGQGTSVFEFDGTYVFMADRWNPKKLCDSRHLWLPIKFGHDGIPFIPWP